MVTDHRVGETLSFSLHLLVMRRFVAVNEREWSGIKAKPIDQDFRPFTFIPDPQTVSGKLFAESGRCLLLMTI